MKFQNEWHGMEKFQAWFRSDEAIKAGTDATIKYDTLRTLSEFTL